jgi:predicted secreted Zn-dependent protease
VKYLAPLAIGAYLFLRAADAHAHDCSSASDCGDVVKTTGWLEAALAAALAIAIARSKGKRPYKDGKPVKHRWEDCRAATQALQEMDGKNGHPTAAQTEWDPKYTPRGKAIQQADGSWTYTGTVTTRVEATVTLPEWENIPADPAIQKAWADTLDALRAHEEVHVAIAQEGVKSLDGASIRGTGPTAEAAERAARAAFEAKLNKVADEIRTKQDQYDDKTDHGLKQDAIGGKQTKLICPGR